MRHLISFALVSIAVSGCESGSPRVEKEPAANAAPTPPPGAKTYGAPVNAGTSVPISKILADPDQFAGQTAIVEGQVRKACAKKGCWMEVAESVAKDKQGARVTFKDYGFFVPKDSAGSNARLEGVVNTKTVSRAEVEHMEAEGATFAHKYPGGTAREVRIVATGVELTR